MERKETEERGSKIKEGGEINERKRNYKHWKQIMIKNWKAKKGKIRKERKTCKSNKRREAGSERETT